MAAARVTHRPNWAGIDAVLRGPTGGVRRDLRQRGRRVSALARQYAGRASGRLHRDLAEVHERTRPSGDPEIWVGSGLPYAWVHHQGHGWIYPHPPRRALRFRPKGSRRWVFARKVRPVRGTFYLRKAIRAAR